jgi:Transmembrane domain of unknown function (DUF3566)
VDQRVEPPSWLPGGTAASDNTKGQAGSDSADGRPDDTENPESQGPEDSFGSPAPATQSYAADPPRPAAADANAYSYSGETLQSNGRDAGFGSEGAPVSGYGQESDPTAAAADPAPYPPPFTETGSGFADPSSGFGDPGSGYGETAAGYSAASPGFGETTSTFEPAAPAFEERPPSVAAMVSNPGQRAAPFSGVTRPKTRTPAGRGRRADLVVARFEPWSVMKFSFLISLVAWVILFVAVAVLYFALSALGVFDSVQKTLESVTSSSGSAGVSLSKWFSASRILGYTMLIGAVNIILITAFATVGSMIYNLVTHLGGGIEVTLRETD